MMKRLYILLILLTAAFWGSGQTYLPDNTFGKTFNRILPFYALGIPNDTLAPPVAYQHYPHLAGKDSILYMWSPSLKRFRAVGGAATSGGGGGSYTFLAPLSNDGGVVSLTSVPWGLLTGKPTTLSGYGITDAVRVSDTAAMLSGYMRKGVAGSAGHTHIGADITDGTTWFRNMLSGGTGVVYNNATGVIAIDSALVKQWLSSSTYTFSGPLSESAGTVSITQAGASTDGYLSAADYQKFFAKTDSIKVRDDSLFEYKNGTEYARGKISATIDSFLYATRRYVDSSTTVFGSRLYDTYNTHDTLTQSRNIDLNDIFGLTFTVDGTNDIATGINASGFTTKRSKHDFTANNGWIYGQLHDPAQVYKSRFQVIGLVNDSTHSAQLISTNSNTYNQKAALVSAAWWEGAKMQANVNWTTSGSTSGYKGIYVYSTAGDGTGQVKIDREVLSVGSATDSAYVRKSDGTTGLYPLSGGGGASYTPTITTQATSTTLSTDYETWVFTGSSAATFTLPATGTRYVIKSRGSAFLTLSGTMYSTAAISSLTVYPGDSYTLQWDGTYWIVY